MIVAKTPYRISFFGGGTDYPQWYNENNGSVLSTSIDKYCYISCRELPPFFDHKYRIVYSNEEKINRISQIKHPAVKAILKNYNCNKGLEIHHDGDLPARSGIGSSSSFCVGLINAISSLNNKICDSKSLSKQAINIEQNVIGENVGDQDQIAAAYGGLNHIKFTKKNNFKVTEIINDKNNIKKIENNLMLFYTGLQRRSSNQAKKIITNINKNFYFLNEISKMPKYAINSIKSRNFAAKEFGELLNEAWLLKKELSNSITNDLVDEIYSTAINSGALGGKLLGAGNGGFILFYIEKKNRAKLLKSLNKLIHVPFKFENKGSHIILN